MGRHKEMPPREQVCGVWDAPEPAPAPAGKRKSGNNYNRQALADFYIGSRLDLAKKNFDFAVRKMKYTEIGAFALVLNTLQSNYGTIQPEQPSRGSDDRRSVAVPE